MSVNRDWVAHRALPTRTTEEPTEVLRNVFLGGHPGRYNSRDKRMGLGHPSRLILDNYGIRLVVCCCASANSAPFVLDNVDTSEVTLFTDEAAFVAAAAAAGPRTVAKYNIAAKDEEWFDMGAHFPRACRLMRTWLEGRDEAILVHCQAGMSRSATVLAAYLIARYAPPALDQGETAASVRAALGPAAVAAVAEDAAEARGESSSGDCGALGVPSAGLTPPGQSGCGGSSSSSSGDGLCGAGTMSPSHPAGAPSASAAASGWAAEVVSFLESRRICVDPNPGFRLQLAAWAAASERWWQHVGAAAV